MNLKKERRLLAIKYLEEFINNQNEKKIINNFLTFLNNERLSKKRVFAYYPVKSEFDVLSILVNYFEEVLLPKIVDLDKKEMKFFFYKKEKTLYPIKKNKFGIPEPEKSYEEIFPFDEDLFLIPSLGCNHDFARLGRGEGYYDLYIRKLKNQDSIKKISLLPEYLTKLQFETEIHDLILDLIITESGILKRKKVLNEKPRG